MRFLLGLIQGSQIGVVWALGARIRFSASWHRPQRASICSEQRSSANCPRLVLPSRSLSTSGISMSCTRLHRTQSTWWWGSTLPS